MKLHPFYEVAKNADRKIAEGWTVFQQFNCIGCGAKQTMPDPNVFHKKGKCEECGDITNIEHLGCNFMATFDRGRKCETADERDGTATWRGRAPRD